MKVTFITAVWRRPEIFAMFAKGIHHLKKMNPNVEINVCVSGSEGITSRSMVEKEGFFYVEVPNDPLGAKMNAASLLAKQTDADYYILLGSDDVIHDDLFKVYLHLMNTGIDYIYVTDCYFFNAEDGSASYWGGYIGNNNRGHALGAGRVLSKEVMRKAEFKCWHDVELSHVLDTAFDQIIEPLIEKRAALKCGTFGVYILDIKSSVNMTKFELWPNTKMIDPEIIKSKFSYLWE